MCFFFLLFICEQFVLPFKCGGEYSAYPRLGAPEPSAPSGEMGAGEPEGVGHKQSAIAQGQSEATTAIEKRKKEYLVWKRRINLERYGWVRLINRKT